MDDNSFDDLLKDKFEGYEHPDIGPIALTSFHDHMSSFPSLPWYSKYRTEVLVTASFILFTLLNGFIVWYGFDKKENDATDLNNGLRHQVIDSLTMVINQLKTSQQQPSVFIINPTDKKMAELTVAQDAIASQDNTKNPGNSIHNNNTKFHLGTISSLPPDILQRLEEEDVLETKDGEAYLLISDRVRQIRHTSYTFESPSHLNIIYENDTTETAESTENIKLDLPSIKLKSRMSSKMVNKIESHNYTKGIGINLAPHLDAVKSAYSEGSGSLTPRLGLTAEWIVSPHWSFETSVDYLNTKFTVNENLQSLNLPNLNPELGNPESVEITTRTLSLPVNLKYRWWLTRKHQLVIKAGYTPYFSLRNEYLYQYPYPGRPADSDLTINTLEQKDNRGFYGGTLNVALGISKLVKKKSQFEAALFYENSLGNVGQQNLAMQLFGIRTAYSFRIK
jgi:hypothetical protein